MPRHLISDAHEWINEIPTVPTYVLAKPQPRERAWRNQRGKKTLNSTGEWLLKQLLYTIKLREHPKAITTKLVWKHASGQGNHLGTVKRLLIYGQSAAKSYGITTRDAVQRLDVGGLLTELKI
jgi:hypothetical protein